MNHSSPRYSARSAAVLVIVLTAVTSACEPRFPVSYMRQALAPGGMVRGDTLPPGPQGLTEDLPPPVEVGWDSIQARGTLGAVMTFNSTSYFIHRGEPMGFEYELLQAFAEAHDLTLEPQVARNRQDLFRLLNRGVGDVVAARLTATSEYAEAVRMSRPLYSTSPVLVQRSGEAEPADDAATDTADDVATDTATAAPLPLTFVDTADGAPFRVDSVGRLQLRVRLVRRPSELAGDTVYMPAGSDYYARIVELSDSLGEAIELVEVQQAEQVEPLIEAVAQGQIQLTVSPENLAELSRARFANLVVTPVVGPRRPIVWAVRQNATDVLDALNGWLASEEGGYLRTVLYRKYFVDRQAYRERFEDEFLTSETGRISPYDSLLERHSKGIGWDWRLLAAQVAQESRFDPQARSWAGARGLLQLMPRTAREMGVSNPNDPESNVAGGVRYLGWLSDLWEDEVLDPEERRKFILASYNAGRGHVLDAQRLAEKAGDDPTKWDDVAYWLLQKSRPEVYRDQVVQHGYVRGMEPVQYVSKILRRYETYRSIE